MCIPVDIKHLRYPESVIQSFVIIMSDLEVIVLPSPSVNFRTLTELRVVLGNLKHRMPLDVALTADFTIRNETRHSVRSNLLTVRDVNDPQLEQFVETIWDQVYPKMGHGVSNFESVKFSEVAVQFKEHRVRKTCPCCKNTVRKTRFAEHVQTCGFGRVCHRCEKEIDGDMVDHRQTCYVKSFPCRICHVHFATGNARIAHERKCRAKEITQPEAVLKKAHVAAGYNVEASAMQGRFKVLSIPVPMAIGPDYRGVFGDMEEQLVTILEELIGTGIRINMGLDVDMTQHINGDAHRHFFQSNASTLTAGSNVYTAIRELAETVVTKVLVLTYFPHFR